MKTLTYIFLLLIVTLISSCGTIDKLASNAGAQEVFFLNSNGDLVIVDGNKGKIVPPCNTSDRKGYGDCKIPFDLDTVKEKANQIKDQLEKTCSSKDCKVLKVKSLLVIDHPGSTCRLIYDRASGNIFQICR